MSQTLKKGRGKLKAETRRQRNLARTQKELEREKTFGKLSKSEKAFTGGSKENQNFHLQQKIKKVIQEAKKKLATLKKNSFYLRVYGRPGKLEDINKYTDFEILYVGKHPSENYYLEFNQEEEESYNFQIHYHYRVYQREPFFFFLPFGEIPGLNQEEKRIFYESQWENEISIGWLNPLGYLILYYPEFKGAYEKALQNKGIAKQKLQQLQENALEAAIRQSEEKKGKYIGENVEAHMRSFLSSRPFARNYSGIKQNFQSINTSLFE
jgi:hypothetical protein